MQKIARPFLFVLILSATCTITLAQNQTRTFEKSISIPSGPGNTLTVFGAPKGSVTITSHTRNYIDIVAKMSVESPTVEGLDLLAAVTGYITEESAASLTIRTVGTHNKLGDKKAWKKFPKVLFGQPFRVDYVIKVPRYLDLTLNGGDGDVSISGVEGSIKISFANTKAKVILVGGSFTAQLGDGDLDLRFPARNWRASMIDVQLAKGNIFVEFPFVLNADVDASALTGGSIINEVSSLKPKNERNPFTERSIAARSGSGGVPLKFTVGNGVINFKSAQKAP